MSDSQRKCPNRGRPIRRQRTVTCGSRTLRGVLTALAVVVCFALASADAYQAITGRRLSKKPSSRSDELMRRQSAIAAVALYACAVIGVIVLLT